jgi:hypothetical protein
MADPRKDAPRPEKCTPPPKDPPKRVEGEPKRYTDKDPGTDSTGKRQVK